MRDEIGLIGFGARSHGVDRMLWGGDFLIYFCPPPLNVVERSLLYCQPGFEMHYGAEW